MKIENKKRKYKNGYSFNEKTIYLTFIVINNILNIGDNILVYYKNIVYKAFVTSFITTNKIDFTACFECEILDIYNKSVEKIYANEFNIDTDDRTFVVYLNQQHLDYYLNQKEYENIVSLLNTAKADLQKTEKRLTEYRAKVKNE